MSYYNTQQLLFSLSSKIKSKKSKKVSIPKDFYSNGFTILNHIASPEDAHTATEIFLANLNSKKLPFWSQIRDRVQLAKADAIPVCDDSVETSFQALHFDMGQAIISSESQLMISTIALYHPYNTPSGGAKTRVLPLASLLADSKWGGAKTVEKKILEYVEKYGDGWEDINTRRLQCFARIIDAVSGSNELADYRDKTMAQWFKDDDKPNGLVSLTNEQRFYSLRGIPLKKMESTVELKPGQLLIIDNTRAAHGRIGKRSEKEIYQFMFGLQATSKDIDLFRKELIKDLTS